MIPSLQKVSSTICSFKYICENNDPQNSQENGLSLSLSYIYIYIYICTLKLEFSENADSLGKKNSLKCVSFQNSLDTCWFSPVYF